MNGTEAITNTTSKKNAPVTYRRDQFTIEGQFYEEHIKSRPEGQATRVLGEWHQETRVVESTVQVSRIEPVRNYLRVS